MISVDFRGVDKTSYRESIATRLLKLYIAYRVSLFKLLFSKSKGLRRGFAIDFGHKPVAFHLALIISAYKASFLQELLEQHIERELPKVRAEIKKLLLQTESEIAGLGDERPTVGHIRMFLTRLSMGFHTLAQAALDGNYHVSDLSFFNEFDEFENPTRLRAEVHRLNGEFAADMRENAQKRKLVDCPVPHNSDQPEYTPQSHSSSELDGGQIPVSKSDFDAWVKEVCFLSLNSNYANASRFMSGPEAESSQGTTIMFSSLSSSTSSPVDGAKSRLIM